MVGKSNPKAAGQLALWAIELSKFDIQYHLRTAVKGQVVTDFIIEFTNRKTRRQMSALDRSYIQMNRLIDRLVEQVLCFFLQKEARLNVWFASTSLPPTIKQSTKL